MSIENPTVGILFAGADDPDKKPFLLRPGKRANDDSLCRSFGSVCDREQLEPVTAFEVVRISPFERPPLAVFRLVRFDHFL
jgi:hypothetical protein